MDFCLVCHPKICFGHHWPPLENFPGGATAYWLTLFLQQLTLTITKSVNPSSSTLTHFHLKNGHMTICEFLCVRTIFELNNILFK